MRAPAARALALGTCLLAAVPAMAQDPPPPGVKSSPGSGFSLFDGESFSAQVGGRIQARYTWEDFAEDRGKVDVGTFTAERVRVYLKGMIYKDWKYHVQVDFGKGQTSLRDAEITWAKFPEATITAGQFKARFDRSQYVSSGRLQFVDRSLAARTFGIEREVGTMVAGEAFDKKFQYNVGLFNGDGRGVSNNNDGLSKIVRFSFNPNGDFGYWESDFKKTDYHLWYVDVAGAWNDDIWKDAVPTGSTSGDGKEQPSELTDDTRYVFGFGYKHAGFIVQGEHYWRNEEREDASLDRDSTGWYAQLGYTIIRDKWEVALRRSEVDPDDAKDFDDRSEWTLGVNRFFKNAGHSLKLQGDVTWAEEGKDAVTSFDDLIVRLQAQIVF